ncbi:MAG: hypothetical protein CMG11_01270 [Candidatus Marinimicrobia bacterium]|nr:hypothetical protein [Candidatus Neomarinimicrobiota bacterium]|tara:strand:- start:21638 stop:22093 length:456 start_codon:yes stop_codon:yes gene_type:complete
MEFSIHSLYEYSFTMLIIIFLYSAIIWFLFSDDNQKIGNNFFKLLLRIEKISGPVVLIIGVLMMIQDPLWMKKKIVLFNIILSLIGIILINRTTVQTTRFIKSEKIIKKNINILRASSMLILLTIFTLGMRIQDKPECVEINGIECSTNKK